MPTGVADRGLATVALLTVFFVDFEREGQRPVIDADGILVLSPLTIRELRREGRRDRVAVFPFAFDANPLLRRRVDGELFAVERRRRADRPFRDANVKRKLNAFDALRKRNGQFHRVVERIVRRFFNRNGRSVADFRGNLRRAVKSRRQAAVGRRRPKMFDVIRPTVRVIVLTAAAAERVHRHERPGVANSRVVILRVRNRLVRASDVTQGFKVGHKSRRSAVERDFLGVIGPERVAGRAEEEHIARQLFENGAGFDSLARVDIALTRHFVAAPHAARDLTVNRANQPEVVVRRGFVGFVFRKLPKRRRFAETLGDVDVMPVRQTRNLTPVRGVLVNFFRDREQLLVAGYIV